MYINYTLHSCTSVKYLSVSARSGNIDSGVVTVAGVVPRDF